MHCSSFEADSNRISGGDVLVAVAALVTEGRIPGKSKSRGFYEGPHCSLSKAPQEHKCDLTDTVCCKYEEVRHQVLELWQKGIPLCVEVLLTAGCSCENENNANSSTSSATEPSESSGLLLEQWYFDVCHRRTHDIINFNLPQLINAVRSQLHFSQISAWLSASDETLRSKISNKNFIYRLTVPGETVETSKFKASAVEHNFPVTDLGCGLSLNISFLSLPRMLEIPQVNCSTCGTVLRPISPVQIKGNSVEHFDPLVDDRMHTSCTLKGKHRCEDFDEIEPNFTKQSKYSTPKRMCHSAKNETDCKPKPKLHLDINKVTVYRKYDKNDSQEKRNLSPNLEQKIKNPKLDIELSNKEIVEVLSVLRQQNPPVNNDLKQQNKGDILLNAILRSSRPKTESQNDKKGGTVPWRESDKKTCDEKCVQELGPVRPNSINECASATSCESDFTCDNNLSERCDIFSIKNKKYSIYLDSKCDNSVPKNNEIKSRRSNARKKITFDDDEDCCKNDFSDNKIDPLFEFQMDKSNSQVIEIPTPVEQANFRKSLDSATSMVFHSRTGLPLTSSPAPVRRGKSCFDFDSSINSVSAIKSALFPVGSDDESESDGGIVSPCSPDIFVLPKREPGPLKYYRRGHAANLLGSFEESVLNGRLEPVSTVHGFKAELGASGSFVPAHLILPVTVFFYSLADNDKVSSPYLAHINLRRKGYNVPKQGTVQVTLFNPLGTVVKMFVIMYDLRDMPPNSQTFIRQRTLYMPANCQDENVEWGPKWLRYLIHLRFMSSKSGRIYLHSDIRMIIFRKSDADTATAQDIDMSYELRSFTHIPSNPQYSPRK